MKPVFQTRFWAGKDGPPANCFAACLASILECQLADLPDIIDCWKPGQRFGKAWEAYVVILQAHLAKQNLSLVETEGLWQPDQWHATWCIISGPSPRNADMWHATVGYGDRIEHDPHPSGAGLIEGRRTTMYFVMIDPRLPRRSVSPGFVVEADDE